MPAPPPPDHPPKNSTAHVHCPAGPATIPQSASHPLPPPTRPPAPRPRSPSPAAPRCVRPDPIQRRGRTRDPIPHTHTRGAANQALDHHPQRRAPTPTASRRPHAIPPPTHSPARRPTQPDNDHPLLARSARSSPTARESNTRPRPTLIPRSDSPDSRTHAHPLIPLAHPPRGAARHTPRSRSIRPSRTQRTSRMPTRGPAPSTLPAGPARTAMPVGRSPRREPESAHTTLARGRSPLPCRSRRP
jgi:hypothetical protein